MTLSPLNSLNNYPAILNGSLISWIVRCSELVWLLVEGKCDATIVDINAIALFRQAIRSSPGRNDGTSSLESIGSGMDVGIVVDDELLHKLISMVEKNELVEELMIAVVDTELNVTEFDG
ncbi:hypothetical protein Tco_0537575 [Tanacetum coccineum]